MTVDPGSQVHFNFSRMAHDQVSPNIAKQGHRQRNGHDHHGIFQKLMPRVRNRLDRKKVDRFFDDQGNKKLEEIHNEKTSQPHCESDTVLDEIHFQGKKSL